MANHTIPRGRAPQTFLEDGAAEGATAPETLRQKDRDRVMNFWKAGRPNLLTETGPSPPKG
jgi:hypothetical protein